MCARGLQGKVTTCTADLNLTFDAGMKVADYMSKQKMIRLHMLQFDYPNI